MTEPRKEHRWRNQDGATPAFKAYHEVYVTKDLGSERTEKLIAFIGKRIAEFKGHAEDKHGVPTMLFERKQDAQAWADELCGRLDIKKEHITIKAQKFTR
jgi:hypothetical protein